MGTSTKALFRNNQAVEFDGRRHICSFTAGRTVTLVMVSLETLISRIEIRVRLKNESATTFAKVIADQGNHP